jgi:hypothetical protein
MPIEFPTRAEIRKALVLALANGAPHYSDDVEVAVADILRLSESQRCAIAGNGRGTRLGNEIDWVKGAGGHGSWPLRAGPTEALPPHAVRAVGGSGRH